MFGLSKKARLIKAVEKACIIKLPIYESALQRFIRTLDTTTVSEEDIERNALLSRQTYLNAVCDLVWEPLHNSPALKARLNCALYSPSITGLPDSYALDHFCDYGISAGAVFAIAYFCLTDKPVMPQDYEMLSSLNHYQNSLLSSIIAKYT